jgi:hypothetical protein
VSGSAATQTPAAVSGWGRTAADPQPMLRRHGGTAQVGFARLRWSSGQIDAASGTAVRMPGHRTRPAEHREPARPALRTPATAAGHGGRCGSGHAGQPAAGPSTTPAAMSDRNGTPMCGTGQHARLTARSVGWGRPET